MEELIPSRTRRPSPGSLVLAACTALALPTALLPGSALATATYLVGMVVVVVSVTVGARSRRGPARRGWCLVAAAAGCWLAGDLVQRALILAGSPDDSPGLQDVLWLASYPLLLAAVVVMLRGRDLPSQVHREVGLDVFVVTVAGTLAAWYLMISPAVSGGTFTPEAVLSVLYPLGDVAVLAAAVILSIAPGRRSTSQSLLVACLASTLLVDAAITTLASIAPTFPAERLDGLLLVGNALLAAAAIHPSGDRLAARPSAGSGPTHLHRWRVVMLGAALVGVNAAAVLAPAVESSWLDRTLLLLASVTMSGAVVGRFYDVVRQRELAEGRLAHRAHHDDLTGLANRSLLLERLERELRSNHDRARLLVVFYLDLDGFKRVNDVWGHAAGDEVLMTVGMRLRGGVRHDDTVARMGGDEFVVLCHDVPPESVTALGDKLCAAVCEPIALASGDLVHVGASIGVARLELGPDPEALVVDPERLIRSADAAMYRVKRLGGGVRAA